MHTANEENEDNDQKSEENTPLTLQIILELRKSQKRSKVTALTLLKRHPDRLKGLSLVELQTWLDRVNKGMFVDAQKLDDVRKLWAEEIKHSDEKSRSLKRVRSKTSPHTKKIPPDYYRPNWGHEPVQQEDIDLLRFYRDKLNLLPGHIFTISESIPEGLDKYKISRVLNGQAKMMKPEHIKWVKERCRRVITDAYMAGENLPPDDQNG